MQYMVYLFKSMCMNQLFYSYLVLALELSQPDVELVVFVCMVAQKLEIVLSNSYPDLCQTLLISYHNIYTFLL